MDGRPAATISAPRAACLTAPGAGGIAVIQVVGRRAAALVEQFLKSKRPIDLERMHEREIRLCRWVDGGQTLDDALVTVRRTGEGESVVDISLHGGPRIVQRALLMLKRAGARIVEPVELLGQSWTTKSGIECELLEVLPRARTRAVASWLAEMADRLRAEIAGIVREIQSDNLDAARASLGRLCRNADRLCHLLDGVGVVLVGEPNVGKSTLANALAGRDHAIVSDFPGTTRDWVEHLGAVDGIPFIFVDTAGLRETTDPVEIEAIRRTRQQIAPADIVLRVMDVSLAPTPADRRTVAWQSGPGRRDHVSRRRERSGREDAGGEETRPNLLLVWNKSDLPGHPGHQELMGQAGEAGLVISARTEARLGELRGALLRVVGLENWRQEMVSPVTRRQVAACRQALSVLSAGRPDGASASGLLQELVGPGLWAEDRPERGYNQQKGERCDS